MSTFVALVLCCVATFKLWDANDHAKDVRIPGRAVVVDLLTAAVFAVLCVIVLAAR